MEASLPDTGRTLLMREIDVGIVAAGSIDILRLSTMVQALVM